MYAVILTGGKQYKVEKGQTLKFEKLELGDATQIVFDKVLLMVDDGQVKVGAPYVAGASVTAELVSQGRAKKVNIIKFRRRKHYMKHIGHRQYFTEVKITDIIAA
ncbi:MAG TPA: 50S ribosomal protein L21 [Coxiellaceae bacterium]|nr:50S ribosomal protein L21 [Coxiellaceae bacterium]